MKIKKKQLLLLIAVWFCVILMMFSFLFALYHCMRLYALSLSNPGMKFNNLYIFIFVAVIATLDITRVFSSVLFFDGMLYEGGRDIDKSKICNIVDFKKENAANNRPAFMTTLGLQRYITELSIHSIIRLVIDISLMYYLIWGGFN